MSGQINFHDIFAYNGGTVQITLTNPHSQSLTALTLSFNYNIIRDGLADYPPMNYSQPAQSGSICHMLSNLHLSLKLAYNDLEVLKGDTLKQVQACPALTQLLKPEYFKGLDNDPRARIADESAGVPLQQFGRSHCTYKTAEPGRQITVEDLA